MPSTVMIRATSLFLLCACGEVQSFSTAANRRDLHWNSSRTAAGRATQLHAIEAAAELAKEMGAARGAFGLCFYATVGVGSVGRQLLPIVFGRYQDNREAAAAGGGNDASAPTTKTNLNIIGYPQPVYLEDVQPIIRNCNAERIAVQFEDKTREKFQYTHIERTIPFLTYDAFSRAHPQANEIARRAVFDSFTNSIGGATMMSAMTAQERIDAYNADISLMVSRLNRSKVLGYSAFALVIVLLGLADYATIYHLWRGFFPNWHGFDQMPSSLIDADIGIGKLGECFLWDIPAV